MHRTHRGHYASLTRLAGYLTLTRPLQTTAAFAAGLAGAALAGGPATAAPILAAIGLALIWAAGSLLTAVCDLERDRHDHPARALPSGIVAPTGAAVASLGLLITGLTVLGITTPRAFAAGLALAALRGVLAPWHRDNPSSPVLHGASWVGLYAAGYFATGAPASCELLAWAGMAFLFAVGFGWVHKAHRHRLRLGHGPIVLILLPVLYALGFELSVLTAAVAGLLTGWVAYALSFLHRDGRRDMKAVLIRLAPTPLLLHLLALATQAS